MASIPRGAEVVLLSSDDDDMDEEPRANLPREDDVPPQMPGSFPVLPNPVGDYQIRSRTQPQQPQLFQSVEPNYNQNGNSQDLINDFEYIQHNTTPRLDINVPRITTLGLGRPHETIDVDDDDDILELDPSEIRSQKFKPTSFEIQTRQVPISLQATPQQHHNAPLQDDVEMIYYGPTPSLESFNFHNYADMEAERDRERQVRCLMAQNERERLKDQVSKLNIELLKTLDRRNMVESQIRNARSELQLLPETDGSRKTILERTINSRRSELFDLDAFIRTCEGTVVLMLNRTRVLLQTIERLLAAPASTSRTRDYEGSSVIVEEERTNLAHLRDYNREGFVPNIYSAPSQDDQDLEQLLDNIRPDEEYEEEGLQQTPVELSIQLLKHQRVGLSWLIRMEELRLKGGLLADDMGLGKTVQAISLIVARKSPENMPTLVVAPVSLLHQWKGEIQQKIRKLCALKVAIYHSSSKSKFKTWADLSAYDVIISSYGMVTLEYKKHFKEFIRAIDRNSRLGNGNIPGIEDGGISYASPLFSSGNKFFRILLDESQIIKNKNTVVSRAVFLLQAEHRFCLSGTPIQNNLDELYPTLRFLRIKPYNSEDRFRRDIAIPIKSNNSDKFDRKALMQKVRALLNAIMLRRTKDLKIDGKKILNLPPKHVNEDYCEMEKLEKSRYDRLESGIAMRAKVMLSSEDIEYSSILTLLLRLRQACCHEYLVKVGELRAKHKESQSEFSEKEFIKFYEFVKAMDPQIIRQILMETGDLEHNIEATILTRTKTEENNRIVNNNEGSKIPERGALELPHTADANFEKDTGIFSDPIEMSEDEIEEIKLEDFYLAIKEEHKDYKTPNSGSEVINDIETVPRLGDILGIETDSKIKGIPKVEGDHISTDDLLSNEAITNSMVKVERENEAFTALQDTRYEENERYISKDIGEPVMLILEPVIPDDGLGNENMFTCPLCYDVLTYDRTLIFPECGHIICKDCLPNFLEKYETGDAVSPLKHRAGCMTCQSPVKQELIVDFKFFHRVHVKKWLLSVALEYRRETMATPNMTTMDIIRNFIADDEGKFVPSTKMEACQKLVVKIMKETPGQKIIIFSQFLGLFDLMKIVFNKSGIKFLRYDGSMGMEEKSATINAFYQDPSYLVLFLSLKAGNVGLTLTCANHVIIMDPFWNPYVEEQAMDRSHRIGQQREVNVHRILIEGTIESRIMELQREKKKLIGAAFDDKEMKNVSKLGKRELGFLFGLNALQ